MLSDHNRLLLIQDSILNIEQCASGGKQRFEASEHIQASILESLREIARASSTFTPKIVNRYPDVDWSKMTSMSTFLRHENTEFDAEIIWLTVEQDVPAIKNELKSIVHTVETMM